MIHWSQSLVFLFIMMKFFVVYEYGKNSFLHFFLQCLMRYKPFPLKNVQFVIIFFFCWTILVGDLSFFHGLFSQQELRDNCLGRSKDYIEAQHFLSWGGFWKFTSLWHLFTNQTFIGGLFESLYIYWLNFKSILITNQDLASAFFISFISNVFMNLPLCRLVKGVLRSGKPWSSVIIPPAAFGGAVISFVLCSSKLVKVSESESLCTAIFFPTSCLWHRAFPV